MANGNYESRRSRRIGKRKLAMVLSLVLLMAMAIGGTMAFLITRSENVANTFAPGHVGCDVYAEGNEWTVKPDTLTNAKVYLRAEVVANYTKDGNIHWSQPTLTVTGTDWEQKDDGFYYYKKPVAPSEKNNVPKLVITTQGTAPTGYDVQIQVLGEAIQAGPDEVNWNNSGMNN